MESITFPIEVTVQIDESKIKAASNAEVQKLNRKIEGLQSQIVELQRQRDSLWAEKKEAGELLIKWNLDSKCLRQKVERLLRIVKGYHDQLSKPDLKAYEKILQEQDPLYKIGL